MNLSDLPADIRELLERFHFDRIPFDAQRARIGSTADLESLHMIPDAIGVPPVGAATRGPPADSSEYRALQTEGEEAIARGELGALILAGGMATRFGSKVKGLAPLFEDRAVRFIDAKLADVRQAGRGRAIDTTLMTSFATDAAIAQALEGQAVHRAPQFVSLRLTARGELFHDAAGNVSAHAPGHGDLPEAMQVSGALERLQRAGVKTLLVSNVDNLGATVDPVLFALHRRGGKPISVELVPKRPGDKGGMPVMKDGRLVLAEAFRLPKEFPQDQFPLFNTNTLWLDLTTLEGSRPWTWCIARKKVDGLEAIQIERLVGELTWWFETQYLEVPRDGEGTRFVPIKEQEDLRRARAELEHILRTRMGMAL